MQIQIFHQLYKRWFDEISRKTSQKINIVLIGNKSDLVDHVIISKEQIKDFASKQGFHYILTSAKTGENVNDAFMYVASKMIEIF